MEFEEFKNRLAKASYEGQYPYNGICVAFDDTPLRNLFDELTKPKLRDMKDAPEEEKHEEDKRR